MTTLESTDIDQAREYFDRTQNLVIESTAGLSDAQWHFKPAPDRWSIAENLEHMVTIHERVLGRVLQQLPQAPAPPPEFDAKRVDAIVFERIPDHSTMKANAPDMVRPTGQLAPAESLDRLLHGYQRLHKVIESTSDLRDHVLESPPLRYLTNGEFTVMDGYQWAVTAAAHDERHVRQIQEVKAHPDYPA